MPEPARLPQALESRAARLLGVLPPALKRRLAGPPIQLDGLELDLDMQVLVKLDARNARGPLDSLTAERVRAELRRSARSVEVPSIPAVSSRELTVAGAAGPLNARLYTPQDSGPGLVVYFHGGGWVAGDLDTHDQPCRLLARSSGARVLSVDYRLAPEHPFPAAVEDALAAFRDAHARAAELGAEPGRIAVAGDSAGGHLAAVTALQCARGAGPAPLYQLLIYPAVDMSRETASRRTFAEGFLLTKVMMDWYQLQFIGAAGDTSDPLISPLLAEDLSGLAPAMVVTAGFDPLRDEGEAYAHRLTEAGVPTLLRRYPGYVHGFTHALAASRGPWEALSEMGGVLRLALGQAPAVKRD